MGIMPLDSQLVPIILPRISIKRFPKDFGNDSIGFRCYKSSVDGATIQIRNDKMFASVSYVSIETLDEIIVALQTVRAEISRSNSRMQHDWHMLYYYDWILRTKRQREFRVSNKQRLTNQQIDEILEKVNLIKYGEYK